MPRAGRIYKEADREAEKNLSSPHRVALFVRQGDIYWACNQTADHSDGTDDSGHTSAASH
jgi:hypothetical protein